jgi:6-methylsalicylate decarboxylase
MQATTPIIDVHHHFEPTAHNVDGSVWSVEMALDQLDRANVATAIAYGGPILGANGRDVARRTNEWSTEICRAHPGRFGLFASLPMEDVDASLAEIAYAFDVLGADGVGIAPSYSGAWLGEARFRPIFEELNRRAAVVYVHPAKGSCSVALGTLNDPSGVISAPWIEFPTETARTIVSLWLTETTRQLADIKFLFCHGGGVLPILLGRIAGFSGWADVGPEPLARLFPDGIYAEFAKLYFELAQAYAPEAFALLRTLVPPTHILYGSDFSYFPMAHSIDQFNALAMSEGDRRLIQGGNAARLLPRWS